MSKNLSAKYYKESKERLQKKAREIYQNQQYGCELSKIKNKSLFRIKKNIIE